MSNQAIQEQIQSTPILASKGLQLIAAPNHEPQLLAGALAVERCLGTGLERLGTAPGVL